jgi:hypothetical protein
MGVGIVLGAVVSILRMGLLGRESLQPLVEILAKALFVVVDEHASGNVHRVDERYSLPDPTFGNALLNVRCNVDKRTP